MKKYIVVLLIFLIGCQGNISNKETFEEDIIINNKIFKATYKPENEYDLIIMNEYLNRLKDENSKAKEINILDIKQYYSINELKEDEENSYIIDTLKIEVEKIEEETIIVFLLYEYINDDKNIIEDEFIKLDGVYGKYFVISVDNKNIIYEQFE